MVTNYVYLKSNLTESDTGGKNRLEYIKPLLIICIVGGPLKQNLQCIRKSLVLTFFGGKFNKGEII